MITLKMKYFVSGPVVEAVFRNATRLALSYFTQLFTGGSLHINLERTVAGIGTARSSDAALELPSEAEHFVAKVVRDVDDEASVGTTTLPLET